MARVTCPHCGAKATVTSREDQSSAVTHLYAACSNIKDCSATFRVTMSFDHYLNPPIKNTYDLAASLLRTLPQDQQLDLLKEHQAI